MDEALPGLERLLDAQAAPLRLWWRDDDTGRDDPALDGLLAMAGRLDIPLMLAVVPAWLEAATVRRIRRAPHATVFQHGWAHVDHARDGERKIELGDGIPAPRLAQQLDRGRELLARELGPVFHPVMVPPWNRMAPAVGRMLPELGFRALSAMKSAGGGDDFGPLPGRHVHLDVMDWRGGASLLPPAVLVDRLAQAILRAGGAPLGIMTHHQVTTPAEMGRLEVLLCTLRAHPRVTFLDAAGLVGT